MDLVRKKVLQSQVNSVGRQLGLSAGRGTGAAERVEQVWNSVTSRANGENDNGQHSDSGGVQPSDCAEVDVFAKQEKQLACSTQVVVRGSRHSVRRSATSGELGAVHAVSVLLDGCDERR